MTEIWKDVCYYKNGVFYDFTGYYQVSNLGRVKSLKREGITRNGKKFIVYEKILKLIEVFCGGDAVGVVFGV